MSKQISTIKDQRKLDAEHLNVPARSPFAGAGLAMVIVLLLATLTVHAQSSMVLFISSPGDYIGGGQTYITEDPTQISIIGTPSHFTVAAFGLSFDFGGPGGTNLTVGAYPNSIRWPFNGNSPGLDI